MSSTENPTYITTAEHPQSSSPGPIKPTLLAFHGSGSNATVHTVQLARLMRLLRPHFDVESLEAPFASPAGPGVLPFFDGCGPFYRWLPPSQKITLESMRAQSSTSELAPEVEALIKSTVQRIRAAGGRVVGLIGFSQGTKIVAGLLRASEFVKEYGLTGEDVDWLDFSFGLSVCGSYAPLLMPGAVRKRLPPGVDYLEGKIRKPTFHVQGTQDEWEWAGKGLIERHYEKGEGKSEVVEWDMGHHYPVEAEQSERIAEWAVGVWKGIEGGEVR
ncbi:hypothetical protein HBH98_192790 [Parastagonospora nodorum]|nr:hypothetical protein HBH53_114660 [Parastagonospora nodorum]KAH4044660.1 hypothetical protein HBH49_211430 [Parastagonospora nodorum]KAH4064276.1 hypothetical protein HBH50_177090 [Parastagonospora nodorum]KAH4084303.1 hypothetical protein HBH48_167400 [Parastagonospora nodorum]KAH4116757.1 hypothetical protein HBH47_161350 [Parastagonospora nodorum]